MASARFAGTSEVTWAWAGAPAVNAIAIERTQVIVRLIIAAPFGLGPAHLDDVVVQRSCNLLKPGRHSIGNDDDVAFRNRARIAVTNGRPSDFSGRHGFRLDDRTSRYECRRTFEDVNDVGVLRMNFGHSVRFSM